MLQNLEYIDQQDISGNLLGLTIINSSETETSSISSNILNKCQIDQVKERICFGGALKLCSNGWIGQMQSRAGSPQKGVGMAMELSIQAQA